MSLRLALSTKQVQDSQGSVTQRNLISKNKINTEKREIKKSADMATGKNKTIRQNLTMVLKIR